MNRPHQQINEHDTLAAIQTEFDRACRCHADGDLVNAERVYRALLERAPEHVDARCNLGVLLKQRGDWSEAIEQYRRAIQISPNRAHLHRNLGNVLVDSGRPVEALLAFREAVRLAPDDPNVHLGLTYGLQRAGRLDEAARFSAEVVRRWPSHLPGWEAHGEVLLAERELHAAVACFVRALELDPRATRAMHNLSCALGEMGRMREAKRWLETAVRIAPTQHQSHTSLGDVVFRLEGVSAALPHYRRAVQISPNYVAGWVALGWALSAAGAAEAEMCFERVQQLDPHNWSALIWALGNAGKKGDFAARNAALQYIRDSVEIRLETSSDWRVLANLAYASIFFPTGVVPLHAITRRIGDLLPSTTATGAREQTSRADMSRNARIKIGYLSPNFRDHPVGHVTRSLFALHRRERFEVHGFSTAFRADHPDYTMSIRAGLDHYHVLGQMSAREAATAIRQVGIDILIDLDGYMDGSSPPILALRPAPIQVFWLGHAGGLGLPFVDYLIADRVVVPPGEESQYREQVVRLPHVYHCADAPGIANATLGRAECGLPATGFVFCAFNNPQKITPETFDCWIRILSRVENSVLWLSNQWGRAELPANFRARAERKGVAPERLVFADRVADKAVHLARHHHAGLFLDTANSLSASTTGLDALWAGVPLLTVRGDRFASRIATTFLHCLGLDDLVCETLAEYEQRAVTLALDPAERSRLMARLETAKSTRPLFKTEQFVRELESAFERMFTTYRAGYPPQGFDVPSCESSGGCPPS